VENTGNSALLIILLVVELLGLIVLVIPGLPGLGIIWVCTLIYAFIQGLYWPGSLLFALITILMLIGSLADNILMGAGARKTGVTWFSIGLALLAGVIGSILFFPFGGPLFALAGLFIIELLHQKDWRKAFMSSRNLAAGCGWAVIARLIIGAIMISLWGLWVMISNG
jgi:uncharacterized protein